MPDLPDPNNAYLVLALIVPGLIITYVRAQFITGRMQKHSDAILSYFALSVVYGAIALPISEWWVKFSSADAIGLGFWFLLIFIFPALLGLILGLVFQTEILRSLLGKIGINLVHGMPTAWDWKFSGMKEHHVIVTLKDDTKFAGYCGCKSFMSSDPHERDIYIEKIYDWGEGENDSWVYKGEHSLLVASAEIKTVEFFPVTKTSN